MKIVCLSASNVRSSGEKSTSLKISKIIQKELNKISSEEIDVEIIPLLDYTLKPCEMCGACKDSNHCIDDEAFNQIFTKLMETDGLFVVCPHYAPIPSKLMILLEKFEEITFLNYCKQPNQPFALSKKPVGIIAHGGSNEEGVDKHYKKVLLEPLANIFRAIQMDVIGVNEEWSTGVTFGIKDYTMSAENIFAMEHDWEDIENRIEPLVKNLVAKIQARSVISI